jgi:uncharacterized protein
MPVTVSRRAFLRALSLPPAAAVAAGCQAAPAPALTVAAGELGGFYVEFSELLVRQLKARGIDARFVETDGSVDNLRKVAGGKAELGLALTDMVLAARNGDPPFGAPLDLRAVGRVYENYMQLVVRAEDPVSEVADLAGRPVSLGAQGSGAAVFGDRLLVAAGIEARVRRRLVQEAALELESGEIDALLWSGGVPTPALAELAHRRPVRLIPLQAHLPRLRERHGAVYGPATVPAGVYGVPGVVATVGVANLLIGASLPDDIAGSVARTLVTAASALVPSAALGTQYLDQQSLIGTGDVPLHDGAAVAYREMHG